MTPISRVVLSLALAAVASPLAGCRSNPPDISALADGPWSTYENESVGYSVDYPEALVVRSLGGEVWFHHEGSPVVRVVHVTEEQGRKRGLWVLHDPVASAALGEREGFRYVYDHYDGPFPNRTIAYVVPHRGKLLALEFRTNGDEGREHQRIRESFRIE